MAVAGKHPPAVPEEPSDRPRVGRGFHDDQPPGVRATPAALDLSWFRLPRQNRRMSRYGKAKKKMPIQGKFMPLEHEAR